MLKNCEICSKSKDLKNVLNLGNLPLVDDLIKINSKKKNYLFKTEILFCSKCITAYQKFNVRKKRLFPSSYHYRSRMTDDVIKGIKSLVSDSKKYIGNLKNKVVLDIGCNDGSLLDQFKKENCKTIGVEPTNAALDAKNRGHFIYKTYFDNEIVKKLNKKFKKIDIITFTNVFAHIENLPELIKNLKKILSHDTYLIIENHYLGSILKKKQFDTFYHEHPRTYSLTSFIKISKLLELKILNYSFPSRYGGNIRVVLKRRVKKKIKYDKKLINQEKKFINPFYFLNKSINNWKKNKIEQLKKLKKTYGRLSAKAFPGRASIIIKILGVDSETIQEVFEKPNSKKIGFYVPGTRIPIKSDKVFEKKISKLKIIINLAWHIKKEIRKYLKKMQFKGKIINIIDTKDFE